MSTTNTGSERDAGTDGADAEVDPRWAWAPYEPDDRRPWNLVRVGHLYRRAAFGARWGQLCEALKAGPGRTVDGLLAPDADVDAFNREQDQYAAAATDSASTDTLRAWWLRRMIETPHPLLEKMTLFWHDHFATSNIMVKSALLMHRHEQTLRRHALGCFRSLLEQVALHPALLLWLDAAANRRARPSEQYARSEIIARRKASGDYPDVPFARMLATVAGLFRADLGIRIYYTELGGAEPGGFDTHANQAANHGALLRQLSEAVAAFASDLERDGLLDRVLLMTFSEFGRTVAENGRRGTGHASAAPMFLIGGKVKGGLIGPHPSLSERENGGLKFHTDFRRVYAAALERWLGVDSQDVLGRRFEPLDVLDDRREARS